MRGCYAEKEEKSIPALTTALSTDILPPMQDLEFIRPLGWNEVFEFWRGNEAGNPDWVKVAQDRGFDSWEEWRRTYVAPFRLEEREWTLHRVTDPMVSVPKFHGGPFRGWIEKIYGDAGPTPTFEEVAKRPAAQENGRVLSLLESFPAETTITGVRTPQGIVVLEGTHRCAAIALAKAGGKTIRTDLTIALGSALPGDLPIVGGHRKGEPPARG